LAVVCPFFFTPFLSFGGWRTRTSSKAPFLIGGDFRGVEELHFSYAIVISLVVVLVVCHHPHLITVVQVTVNVRIQRLLNEALND
jgi:hypothetical protein